ncbi:MAG: hypothetical protein GY906_24285 [bacterium]|nr:hypothetical protein [bacterium]
MTDIVERVKHAIAFTPYGPGLGHVFIDSLGDKDIECIARAAILETLAAIIEDFDKHAACLSNTGRPREDNNYGRAAAMIDKLRQEIEG